jgi:hypothetical protein
MDTPPGTTTSPEAVSSVSWSRVNHRAAVISSPSTTMSVAVARAKKPSIRLDGNGHGWLAA